MKFFALILFGLIAFSFGEDSGSLTDSSYLYDSDSNEVSIEERILNGKEVFDLKKYSYQVGLFNVEINGKSGRCGGSLIHTEVVLTAAHCVQNCRYVVVFHGTTVVPKYLNSPGNIRVEPENVKVHEDYTKSPIRHDIAVINLPAPIRLGDFTSIIPLSSYTWTNCDGDGEVSGWGDIDNDVETDRLRSVNVSSLDSQTCDWYSYSFIKDEKLCIDGSQFKGTCIGDSGGPYVQFGANGERYLCGVVSYGIGKCNNNDPKYFTSVAFYNDNQWICNNTGRKVGCKNGNIPENPHPGLENNYDNHNYDGYNYGGNYYDDSNYYDDNNYVNDNYNGYGNNNGEYVYIDGVLYLYIDGHYYYAGKR